MKIKEFLIKNWTHFAVIAFIFIVCAVFFKVQMDGYGLNQSDVEQYRGMANETDTYRAETGDEALWTNSMFGGMPTTQISLGYEGNFVKTALNEFNETFPAPFGLVILHLLGFYIMALFLRINPLIGLLAGLAFSFASYEIIIIQVGHVTKSLASAFLAPLLGAFIYSYRTRKWLGVGFASIFMALELASNHVQVTYYFAILLVALGFYFLYEAFKEKTLPSFFKITGGLIAGFLLAVVINNGNLLNTNDYVKDTIRGGNDIKTLPNGLVNENESTGLDKEYITNWSYGIGETFTLLSPNVKGGGSFAIAGSHFEETLENADINNSVDDIGRFGAYWGEQPGTSGPVYIGVIVIVLALLGMFFLESKIKWPLFIITILAVLLSWGKNFMGFTEFFIDNVPGYNKFRTVTIILILVELIVPVLGMLFLHQLIKEKEHMKTKMKPILYVLGGFFLFVMIVKFAGLGDKYTSSVEREQLAGVEQNIRDSFKNQDPAMVLQQTGVDVNNQAQLNAFVEDQVLTYEGQFSDLKEVRKSIYDSSMTRTLIFVLLTSGVILLFLYTQMTGPVLTLSLIFLVLLDSLPVSYDYLSDKEGETTEYKYWIEAGLTKYPWSPNSADDEIMASEIAENPDLKAKVDKGAARGREVADESEAEGVVRDNIINSYRFSALNFATNYRVFDLDEGFNSSRASFFHKSLGGYHAAKLRSINNIYEYHLTKMNQKVYDMMNVKYFMRKTGEDKVELLPRPTALGNAWFVKTIEEHENADAEIRGLGYKFNVVNTGEGNLLLNGKRVKSSVVYGGEKLQYLFTKNDSLNVQLPSDMRIGDTALCVMDARGQVNLIPIGAFKSDSLNSFKAMATITAQNKFEPETEAVMLSSEAKKLSAKSFNGEGQIKMVKYGTKRMEYKSSSKSKQFAVFSEVYYKQGWKAYVDGKEVEIVKTNYLLRGIEVPAGNHKIEFVYDLPNLGKSNLYATIASLLVLLGTAFLVYWEYKKNKKETVEA